MPVTRATCMNSTPHKSVKLSSAEPSSEKFTSKSKRMILVRIFLRNIFIICNVLDFAADGVDIVDNGGCKIVCV